MHYNFLVVEGNIGAGKTSLSNMLAKDYKANLILECFKKNPFLLKFYKDPEKHALTLELFFMAERYRQMKNQKDQDLFRTITITDYFFSKSKLFAQNNLEKDELKLFNNLFEIMFPSMPQPDLLIYLYSNVARLQHNIKKRDRDFEKGITDEYLQNIQNRYLDYLRKQNNFPVLLLDISKVDFKESEEVYSKIKQLLKNSYELGVHQFNLAKEYF